MVFGPKLRQKKLKNSSKTMILAIFTESDCRMFVKLYIIVEIDDFQGMTVVQVCRERVWGTRLVEKTLQNEPKSGFC